MNMVTIDYTGRDAEELKLAPLHPPYIVFAYWQALQPVPIADYSDTRCHICNKVIGTSLSFTLVPKDLQSLDEEPEPEPPFHAKCIPRHEAIKSHIVHCVDSVHGIFPGACP